MRAALRVLPRRFPFVEKACFFDPDFSVGGGPPNFGQLFFKIAPISDHVAKFRGDRPSDRGDLALKKKLDVVHSTA